MNKELEKPLVTIWKPFPGGEELLSWKPQRERSKGGRMEARRDLHDPFCCNNNGNDDGGLRYMARGLAENEAENSCRTTPELGNEAE